VQRILREEGVRTLATGLGATCWRNCVWNGGRSPVRRVCFVVRLFLCFYSLSLDLYLFCAVYFGLMHALKDQLPKPTPNATGWHRALDLCGTLVSGTLGGVFATCFKYVLVLWGFLIASRILLFSFRFYFHRPLFFFTFT
jgi:hypothetical protein